METPKTDGWHNVLPEVDQLWLNGKHVGSVSWLNYMKGFEGIVLWLFPDREFANFETKEEARKFVEDKVGYAKRVEFQPLPHTPGRAQNIMYSGFVRLEITDCKQPGLFDLRAYNTRIDNTRPYSQVFNVDADTISYVIPMLEQGIEQLKKHYANEQLPNN